MQESTKSAKEHFQLEIAKLVTELGPKHLNMGMPMVDSLEAIYLCLLHLKNRVAPPGQTGEECSTNQ